MTADVTAVRADHYQTSTLEQLLTDVVGAVLVPVAVSALDPRPRPGRSVVLKDKSRLDVEQIRDAERAPTEVGDGTVDQRAGEPELRCVEQT
ncbi:hypothetical protein [uncultured Friedmanniella sp.]|uniref:hypothetical protein n=1 Tax=uncultured Friedmanniella sp. TaxID=335381 RepID=UPI0035CA9C26